jgi:hypothetical protein
MDAAAAMARLRRALRMGRAQLYKLDVWAWQAMLYARALLMTTMWRSRQPAAVVLLGRHALITHLEKEESHRASACVCWLPRVLGGAGGGRGWCLAGGVGLPWQRQRGVPDAVVRLCC